MSLFAMQRDFRAWLRHEAPGVSEYMRAGGQHGLPIYLNNYRTQLMDCLADTFEYTRAWMGDEAFYAAAATHIDQTPPSAWTLDAYPLGFPDTLATICADSPETAELARLERALTEAFVGADCEPIDVKSLATVSWDEAVLRCAPTARLLSFCTNAAAIWSAMNAAKDPPAAEKLSNSVTLIVWRSGYTSCFRNADTVEAEAVQAALLGKDYEFICGLLVTRYGKSLGIQRAGELLARWMGEGLVVDIA